MAGADAPRPDRVPAPVGRCLVGRGGRVGGATRRNGAEGGGGSALPPRDRSYPRHGPSRTRWECGGPSLRFFVLTAARAAGARCQVTPAHPYSLACGRDDRLKVRGGGPSVAQRCLGGEGKGGEGCPLFCRWLGCWAPAACMCNPPRPMSMGNIFVSLVVFSHMGSQQQHERGTTSYLRHPRAITSQHCLATQPLPPLPPSSPPVSTAVLSALPPLRAL